MFCCQHPGNTLSDNFLKALDVLNRFVSAETLAYICITLVAKTNLFTSHLVAGFDN